MCHRDRPGGVDGGARLVTSEDGGALASVTFRDPSGRAHSVHARRFVLAAGGIENPRLLLASNAVQKRGIGNDHDLVGRFFMEHIDFDTGFFRPANAALFRDQLAWRRAGDTLIRNSLALAEPVRRREQLLRCFFHVGEQSVERTYGYRSAAHILKQIRPRHGVVDANCRVHGVHNLYVAGSSVFPTAGSGTPTLMIVALASRLAEHLDRQFQTDAIQRDLRTRAAMPG